MTYPVPMVFQPVTKLIRCCFRLLRKDEGGRADSGQTPGGHQLPDDTLLLVDMGLCGYEMLARVSTQAERRFWMTRKKSNVRYRVVKSLGPGEELVLLCRPKGLDPELPAEMVARAIHYHWPGYRPQTPLTSLLSPEHFPASQLVAQYHERWKADQLRDELQAAPAASQDASGPAPASAAAGKSGTQARQPDRLTSPADSPLAAARCC